MDLCQLLSLCFSQAFAGCFFLPPLLQGFYPCDDFLSLPSVSQLVQKSLCFSVKLSLTDHQKQREEEWTEREKERKKERK